MTSCRACRGDGCAVCACSGDEPDEAADEFHARVMVAMLRAWAEKAMREARADALEAEADAFAALDRLEAARDRLAEWTARAERACRYTGKLPP